ncbi:surface protein-2 [Trypanosoma rangeli]|uniref:Surface protein-2 n=1 Tax=Trypanosoma rangeli TaxID=5698 RepID=A0A422NUD4_TRYRA|nr:surface protein-2 [Trypanosoma rangeli]RNF09071.1 surface protein-2 [Trypanosoma rangeli]|eukprot:RNF09071.1 surface protein-2 [Trypanosoma rangeli]
MPKMSRQLFSFAVLLLLFFLMCCGAGVAEDAKKRKPTPSKEMEIFVPQKTEVTLKSGDSRKTKVASFNVPAAVGVAEDMLVVFAEAQYTHFTDTDVDIIAAYGASSSDAWKTQLAVEMDKSSNFSSFAVSPTAVARNDKIYLLVKSEKLAKGDSDLADGADTWDIKLAVGDVTGTGEGATINWQVPTSLKSAFDAVMKKNEWNTLSGGGGAGIVAKGGILMLPVTAEKENTFFSTIAHSTDGEKWVVSSGATTKGCTDPAIVEWEDGKVLMSTPCNDGVRRVTSRATWGRHGRRRSGHSHACGATHPIARTPASRVDLLLRRLMGVK